MKLFIALMIVMIAISCNNDDSRENTVLENSSINGLWKPYKYEYKGKMYAISDCQQKGQILINTDFSGAYERYDISTSGNCNLFDSFTGKWSYNNMNKALTLTYTESGATKTIKKDVETFSDTELRISDDTKNVDNMPGNDDATLVFIKQ